ncbi:probable CCR4-associated factor 1 homolog 7 [Nymphaea colorata]|uniref:probable CCR4-associated factor 1 homolog 7 n=1 Tax=Nymphaea colorata TaxID=210225 RepID=UPI00129EB25D|nr:probable CCR4-associated factor 1 homolog 7 [Nymphaea colorata]
MKSNVLFKRVWKDNLEEEMSIIKGFLPSHQFVSLTTRLLRCRDRVPPANDWGDIDVNYATLRLIGDNYKSMVQVGLAFSDKQGMLPRCPVTKRPCVWEFNLMAVDDAGNGREAADLSEEEERFLQECCSGTTGERLRREGIHPGFFAVELWQCAVLMQDHICWVVFKGGLDFVALLRWVRHSVQSLPADRAEFLKLLLLYFPLFYDLAALMGLHDQWNDGTIGGLGRSVNMEREGEPPHGAAADCLLAMRIFTALMKLKLSTALLEYAVTAVFGVSEEGLDDDS